MNTVTWLHPAPWCPLPIVNQARAYTRSDDTDVRRTIEQHTTAPSQTKPEGERLQ